MHLISVAASTTAGTPLSNTTELNCGSVNYTPMSLRVWTPNIYTCVFTMTIIMFSHPLSQCVCQSGQCILFYFHPGILYLSLRNHPLSLSPPICNTLLQTCSLIVYIVHYKDIFMVAFHIVTYAIPACQYWQP